MKQDAKIQCLNRIEHLCGGMTSLLEYLVNHSIVTKDKAELIYKKPPTARATETYVLLESIKDSLQMLSWEWSILPSERIKITVVTSNHVQEFTWGE